MKKYFFTILAISALLMTACTQPGNDLYKTETVKTTIHCVISDDVEKYFDLDIKCTIDGKDVENADRFVKFGKVTNEDILSQVVENKDRLFEYTGEIPVVFTAGQQTKVVQTVVTLHRNKNVVVENSFLISHGLYMTTPDNIEFNCDLSNRLYNDFESIEDANSAIMIFDGIHFEESWVVNR